MPIAHIQRAIFNKGITPYLFYISQQVKYGPISISPFLILSFQSNADTISIR
jgi:hypothetical protein